MPGDHAEESWCFLLGKYNYRCPKSAMLTLNLGFTLPEI